jgi:hypothetical protein
MSTVRYELGCYITEDVTPHHFLSVSPHKFIVTCANNINIFLNFPFIRDMSEKCFTLYTTQHTYTIIK